MGRRGQPLLRARGRAVFRGKAKEQLNRARRDEKLKREPAVPRAPAPVLRSTAGEIDSVPLTPGGGRPPMPIRFRCAYCNQLLGIARRKAGQVVRCPTCAGQVVVPTPEEMAGAEVEAESDSPPDDGASAPVFERSDFDQIFQVPEGTGAAGPPASLGRTAAAAGAPPEVEPFPAAPPPSPVPVEPPREPEPAPPPAGVVLSPKKATVLTVLVILS